MSKIAITEFVSLDGVVEDPGGVEGFEHGGWVLEINQGDGVQFKLDEALASDAMLLGMDDLETFEWRGVDLLWERKP